MLSNKPQDPRQNQERPVPFLGLSSEDQTSPDGFGLPISVERVLLAERGCDLVIKLLKIQQSDEDNEELAYRYYIGESSSL